MEKNLAWIFPIVAVAAMYGAYQRKKRADDAAKDLIQAKQMGLSSVNEQEVVEKFQRTRLRVFKYGAIPIISAIIIFAHLAIFKKKGFDMYVFYEDSFSFPSIFVGTAFACLTYKCPVCDSIVGFTDMSGEGGLIFNPSVCPKCTARLKNK